MMEIPLKIDLKGYFKLYLMILNPLLKLKDREIDVLASFLMLQHTNRSLPIEQLNKLLFSTKVRKIIRESIGMSEASFNNHVTALRKKKILKGKSINPVLQEGLPKDKKSIIKYNIEINE